MARPNTQPHPHFVTDDELATWKPKPELVKGLLSSGEVNMLFAPKNRGKTFLGLDLAYSIATNQATFLGRKILQHGSVVYLGAEGRNGLVLRREAWRIARKYAESCPKLAFWRELLDLRDEEAVETLVEQIRETYPDCVLVVVDTLSQHMPGGDEGTAAMSAALHACQRIRDAVGCSVLAIHHPTKKDEANERGGSGFRGGCADVLNVEEKDGMFYVTTQNARDRSADTEPIPYVLDVVMLDAFRDEEGNPLTSCVVRHVASEAEFATIKAGTQELDRQILDALAESPQSMKSLAREIKKRPETVAVALDRLKGLRQISKDARGQWTKSKSSWSSRAASSIH